MTSNDVDPARCPLCSGENGCGMVAGNASCWCFSAQIPAEVLARIPPAAQGVACICESCASGATEPKKTLPLV